MSSIFTGRVLFFQKPIVRRFSVPLLAFSVTLFVSARTEAQVAPKSTELTEEVAVRRALSLPALEEVTEGLVGIARSEEVREGLWPNPELAFNREEIRGDQGAVQDFLMLSQAFDFSGRRGLKSKAADLRVQAVRGQGEAFRSEIEAEVRLRFHELLTAQLRVRTIQSWMERIESTLRIVTRREAVGDAASYERYQLEREVTSTQVSLSMHEAERGQAWARLAPLLGEVHLTGGPPEVSGSLLPGLPEPSEQLVSRIKSRPDIVALGVLEEAAEVDSKAASRWWVPKSTLGFGWTALDLGTQRDDGYIAMATISLPLFERSQAESIQAASEARLARGRQELALTQALGEIRIRAAELTRLIDVAERHRRDVVERSGALIRTAEAGYAGDELRILELLDAYRGAIDDEMSTLALEFAARKAHIHLDLISGGYTP